MTALQTQFANEANQEAEQVFRIFQMLESSGDIFEINSGIQAAMVGPQSDVANLKLDYYDKQQPNLVNEVFVAVNNPWVAQTQASSRVPGNLVVTTRDLVDNTYLPRAFGANGGDFVAARPKPMIDIVTYLRKPNGLAPLRDDKEFFFPFISTAGIGVADAYYILPYYGRRYGHINLVNLDDTANVYTLTVWGVNLSVGAQTASGLTPGGSKAAESPLGTLVAGAGVTDDLVINANTDGLFDLLALRLVGSLGAADPNSTLRVTVSDTQ